MALTNCPHCDRELRTGAVFNSHERKCARDRGVPSVSKPNNYTKKRGKRKGGSASDGPTPLSTAMPQEKRSQIKPGDWLMWNRGTFRGWAFASVSKKTPSITLLESGHLGRLTWETGDLEEDVRAGRVFVINPEDICRLLAVQTDRLQRAEFEGGSTYLQAAIENLNLAFYHLTQYRECYE